MKTEVMSAQHDTSNEYGHTNSQTIKTRAHGMEQCACAVTCADRISTGRPVLILDHINAIFEPRPARGHTLLLIAHCRSLHEDGGGGAEECGRRTEGILEEAAADAAAAAAAASSPAAAATVAPAAVRAASPAATVENGYNKSGAVT